MSVLILPTAMLVVFFAREILILWVQDPITVGNTYNLVRLLIIGTALNGLMTLPYALQLAHGWTSLAFYTNLISLIVLLPLLIFATSLYGALGAAAVWIVLNSGYLFISIQVMHRRLLKGEQWHWYFKDIGLPMVATISVIGIGRILIKNQMPLPNFLVSLAVVFILALTSASLAAPQFRAWVFNRIWKKMSIYGS